MKEIEILIIDKNEINWNYEIIGLYIKPNTFYFKCICSLAIDFLVD